MQRHQAVKSARGGDGHDDDDEPIVYYDLDAGSMRQNPLLYSPKNARGSAHATAKRENLKGKKSVSSHRSAANGILQRPREIFHQQPLFQLDDDHESEDENPFASLLLQQQPQQHKPGPFDAYEDDADYVMQTASPPELQASTATFSRETTIIAQKRPQVKNAITMSSRKSSSPVRVTPPRHATSAIVSPDDSAANTLLSLLRRERPQAKPSATVAAAPKRLSVEPADSRPSRWSQKSTVTSAGKKAANRRKSVPNALQRKHRTGRTSLPLSILGSHREEDEEASQSGLPKRRRLADVLMRATLLSQQKPQYDDERLSQQHHTSNESSAMENDDAIADTELQMREEKFETQIFSPSKLNNQSALARKKQQKPNAAVTASKIRGELGEAVARAIRKITRDLTMLHSHGQTLIEQSSGSMLVGLDRVQDRGFTVVRLRHKRSRQPQQQEQKESSGDLTVYDACIQRLSPDLQAPCDEKSRIRVAFSAQIATQLRLQKDAHVKIYAPFHFIPLVQPVGSLSALKRPKWLLVGTTLAEITTSV